MGNGGARWRVGLASLLALLAACPRTSMPPPPGILDGGRGDAPRLLGDTDGDGLCDRREAELGSAPERADTDGDGVPDGIELLAGFDPTDLGEPSPSQRVMLRGRAGASAAAVVQFAVRGRGEDFQAAFEAPERLAGVEGSALDHFRSLRLVGASPAEAVGRLEEDAARARGVVGRVVLSFEVRFEVPADGPYDCSRGLPFSVTLKRSDGARWPTARHLLEVQPEGGAPWCPWRSPCI